MNPNKAGKMRVMTFPGKIVFVWEAFCGEKPLCVLRVKTQGG